MAKKKKKTKKKRNNVADGATSTSIINLPESVKKLYLTDTITSCLPTVINYYLDERKYNSLEEFIEEQKKLNKIPKNEEEALGASRYLAQKFKHKGYSYERNYLFKSNWKNSLCNHKNLALSIYRSKQWNDYENILKKIKDWVISEIGQPIVLSGDKKSTQINHCFLVRYNETTDAMEIKYDPILVSYNNIKKEEYTYFTLYNYKKRGFKKT